ncbi:5134_t:CDS:2, partial [Racocetra persica]
MVTKEVVKNLKEVRFKQWKNRRSRLCYECRKVGHIAYFCPQQTRSEKDDNELKRTMKEQVMRSPSKGDIGIDEFNGVVFQQIVNGKEYWNGKDIGQPVNMRRLSLEKQFEIARVVGLEDLFDNVYEIPVKDIPSKNVNRNVVNNGVKLQMIKRKMSRKVGNNEYADLGESALRIDNAKVKVMESLDEDGSNPKKLDMSCIVGENKIQRFNSSPI